MDKNDRLRKTIRSLYNNSTIDLSDLVEPLMGLLDLTETLESKVETLESEVKTLKSGLQARRSTD